MPLDSRMIPKSDFGVRLAEVGHDKDPRNQTNSNRSNISMASIYSASVDDSGRSSVNRSGRSFLEGVSIASSSSSRRGSNASDYSGSSQQQLLPQQQQQQRRGQQQQRQQQQRRKRPSNVAANAAINVDGDGPSLAAALAQSIRHHSRMIDGERQDSLILGGFAGARGKGGAAPVSRLPPLPPTPAYDPYQDDDHVSLAPDVELNYGKDAAAASSSSSRGGRGNGNARGGNGAAPAREALNTLLFPALRDFVANAAVREVAPPPATAAAAAAGRAARSGGEDANIAGTVERQQQRIERLQQDSSRGVRLLGNISNWFGMYSAEAAASRDGTGRTVRFAEAGGDPAAVAAGEAVPGLPPGATVVGFDPRAPKFVVPPPSSFRTATRHPSHLPASSEFDDLEARLDAPRRMLAARKRHRRNDSMLRLMIAVLCFGTSLAFAIVYGEGRFGLAVTTMAYERKVDGRQDLSEQLDAHDLMQELMMKEEVAYPDWWEREWGIPDMESRDIKFSPTLEYNAADVTTPRAPDRIETPFFWTVPRTGGNVIRTIMSTCLRLAEASEYGEGRDEPV